MRHTWWIPSLVDVAHVQGSGATDVAGVRGVGSEGGGGRGGARLVCGDAKRTSASEEEQCTNDEEG